MRLSAHREQTTVAAMFRDRTNLYLLYRRTVPRTGGSRAVDLNEEENLIGNRRFRDGGARLLVDGGQAIEMKPLVPLMFEIADELSNNLTFVKNQVNELNGLYKKLIIVNQLEKPKLEESIEELNYRVLKDFEKCYVLVKKFEYLEKNHQRLQLNYTPQDLEILSNYKKNYARQILERSMMFRNMQNNYIKFLNNDDDETDMLLLEESETKPAGPGDSIEEYSKQVLQTRQQDLLLLQQRDREISKLAMGILEILTIFKEMESMVVDQGTLLDRIDYNLHNTVADLQQLDRELVKARSYQKRTTKCKLIFLLLLVVAVLFMIVIVKPHGKTKVVETPAPQPGQPQQPEAKPEAKPEVKPDAGSQITKPIQDDSSPAPELPSRPQIPDNE